MSEILPPRLDPFDEAVLSDPYPTYARLRAKSALCRMGSAQWGVTRYSDVSKLIRDPRLGIAVDVPDEARFFQIVRAAFGQRRKTLANALLPLYGDRARVARLLRAAHVPGERRGETLELEEFARIARHDPPYRDAEP